MFARSVSFRLKPNSIAAFTTSRCPPISSAAPLSYDEA
jgi:hypothetical protein